MSCFQDMTHGWYRQPFPLEEWHSALMYWRCCGQTHGNILQHESWLQLIRARGFVGGHAGPSCEAWVGRCIDANAFENKQVAWGCNYRTLAEVWQCHVETHLIWWWQLWKSCGGSTFCWANYAGTSTRRARRVRKIVHLEVIVCKADATSWWHELGHFSARTFLNQQHPTTLLAARLDYRSYDRKWRCSRKSTVENSQG